MLNQKLAALFIMSALVLPSLGVFAFIHPVSATNGLQDTVLQSEQYTGVAEQTYKAGSDGTPQTSVREIIVMVINAVLGLLGVIFLALIIYAGFLWMMAGGNDEQVGKAKKLLTNSIIGVVIIVAAYAISYFVLTALLPS